MTIPVKSDRSFSGNAEWAHKGMLGTGTVSQMDFRGYYIPKRKWKPGTEGYLKQKNE